MNVAPNLADRLAELVRRRNRELLGDALLKAGFGVLFSFLTFGFVYWFGWFLGFFLWRALGMELWLFAAIFTSIFFVVAVWSAWRRVNPLHGVPRLTDQQWMLMAITQAAGGPVYFSPRHASAGFAVVLIGGPAGVIEAIGIWAHRLRAEAGLIEAAARMLANCEEPQPIKKLGDLSAPFLLRRLGLVKVVPLDESNAITLTDKGSGLLAKTTGATKRPRQ